MMGDSIVVALIAGVCSIIGAFVGQSVASAGATNKMIAQIKNASEISDAKIEGDIAVIKTKLSDLEAKVDKHNAVIERTFKLEQRAELLEERQKVANHRIDQIERERK